MSKYRITSPRGMTYEAEFDGTPTDEDFRNAQDYLSTIDEDTQQSLLESAVTAVPRGAVSAAGSTVEGLGDVFGGDNFLHDAGRGIKNAGNDAFSVNPIHEKSFAVKAGGVVGQVGEQVVETVTGAKLLGALGIAGKAAVNAGIAVPSFLKGADAGEDVATQYGLTGMSKMASIYGAGAIEATTELLGSKFLGGTNLEEALATKLISPGLARALGQSVKKNFIRGTVGEGIEEIEAGIANDLLTKSLITEDPNRPGYTTNGQPMPSNMASGKYWGDRLEEFALGSLGGAFYAGPIALANRSKPRLAIDYLDKEGNPQSNVIPAGMEDSYAEFAKDGNSKVRLANDTENAFADQVDAQQTLLLARERMTQLEAKDALSPEEKQHVEDLKSLDTTLTDWLGTKAAEEKIDAAKIDDPADIEQAVASLQDARAIVTQGARAELTTDPALESSPAPEDFSEPPPPVVENDGLPEAPLEIWSDAELEAQKDRPDVAAFLANRRSPVAPPVEGVNQQPNTPNGQEEIRRKEEGRDALLSAPPETSTIPADGSASAPPAVGTRTSADFANPNESYRVVVGDEAFKDIVDSGKVRTRSTNGATEEKAPGISLDARPTLWPSFSPGQASMSYAGANDNHYIVVSNDPSIQASKKGRHGKGTTFFPTDSNGNPKTSLDQNFKVYKHEGGGKYSLAYISPTAAPAMANPGFAPTENAPRSPEEQQKLDALPSPEFTAAMDTAHQAGEKFTPVAELKPKVGDVITSAGKEFRVESVNSDGTATIFNPTMGRNVVSDLPVQGHARIESSRVLRSGAKAGRLEPVVAKLKKVLSVDHVVPVAGHSEMNTNLQEEATGQFAETEADSTVAPKGAYVENSNHPQYKGQSVLYINKANATADTPIHELVGHQFAPWLKQNNFQLYSKGVELLKKNPRYLDAVKVTYFDEIEAARAKGGDQAAEDYLIEEAMATALGLNGQEIWRSTADSQTLTGQFVAWVKDMLAKFKDWATQNKLFGAEAQRLWEENQGLQTGSIDAWSKSVNRNLANRGVKEVSNDTGSQGVRQSKDAKRDISDIVPDGVLYRGQSKSVKNPGKGAVFYSGDKAYTEMYSQDLKLTTEVPQNVADIRDVSDRARMRAWAKKAISKMSSSKDVKAYNAAQNAKKWLDKEDSVSNFSPVMANLSLAMSYDAGIEITPGMAEKAFMDSEGFDAVTVPENGDGVGNRFSVAFRNDPQQKSQGVRQSKDAVSPKDFAKTLPSSDRYIVSEYESTHSGKPYNGSFVEGELSADPYGDDPFIFRNEWVNPADFKSEIKLEGMSYNSVVNMPSTQKYIEWYKEGKLGPPITVVKKEEDGRRFATNRRRLVAAIEAGVTRIPAMVEVGKASQVMKSPGVRQSKDAPATDADYMKALESGDTEAAQRMVDAAAKAAGYNVGPVYHGGEIWDVADMSKVQLGVHLGTPRQTQFFSKKASYKRLFADMKKPMRLTDRGIWDWDTVYPQLKNKGVSVSNRYIKQRESFQDAYGDEYNSWSNGALKSVLSENGYDSVIYLNATEGVDHTTMEKDQRLPRQRVRDAYTDSILRDHGAADSFIALDPNQIKSADPVTYDSNGNVIPLSQRFNTGSPDIRFSKDAPDVVRHTELEQKHNDGTITPAETEEAQRLVDKAAKAAGYTELLHHGTHESTYTPGEWISTGSDYRGKLNEMATKFGIKGGDAVASVLERWRDNGMLEKFGATEEDVVNARKWQNESSSGYVSRGSHKLNFNTFTLPSGDQELGTHLGSVDQALNFGEYAHPFYVNLGKSVRTNDLGNWDYQTVVMALRRKGVKISDSELDAVSSASDNNEALRDLLASKGVNSIVYDNKSEAQGDSYIALDPNQIKSADPFTGVPLNERFDPKSNDIRFSKDAPEEPEDAKPRKSEMAARQIAALRSRKERRWMGAVLSPTRESQGNEQAIEEAAAMFKSVGNNGRWEPHLDQLKTLIESYQQTPSGMNSEDIRSSEGQFVHDATPALYFGMMLKSLRKAVNSSQSTPRQKRAAISAMAKAGEIMANPAARAGRTLQGFAAAYRAITFPELHVEVIARNLLHGSDKNADLFNAEFAPVMDRLYKEFGDVFSEAAADPAKQEKLLEKLRNAVGSSIAADDIADHTEAELGLAVDIEKLVFDKLESWSGNSGKKYAMWRDNLADQQILAMMDSEAKMSRVLSSAEVQLRRDRLLKEMGGTASKQAISELLATKKAEEATLAAEIEKGFGDIRKPKTTKVTPAAEGSSKVEQGAAAVATAIQRVLSAPTKTSEESGDAAWNILVTAIVRQMKSAIPKTTASTKADKAFALAAMVSSPTDAAAVRAAAGDLLQKWAEENEGSFDKAAFDAALKTMVGSTFEADGEHQPFTSRDAQDVIKDELETLKIDVRKIVRDGRLTNAAIDSVVKSVRERLALRYGGPAVLDRVEAVLRAEWERSLAERTARIDAADRSRAQRKAEEFMKRVDNAGYEADEKRRADAARKEREASAADIREARAEQREKARMNALRLKPLAAAEGIRAGRMKGEDTLSFLARRFGFRSENGQPVLDANGNPKPRVPGEPVFSLKEFLSTLDENVRKDGVEDMLHKVAEYLGYDRYQTERFISPVLGAAMSQIDAARTEKLKKIFEPDAKKRKARESEIAKHVRLIKMGALDQEAYANVLLGARGKKGMTPEFKALLTDLIRRRDLADEGTPQRIELDAELAQAIAAARGVSAWEYMQNIFGAHIFSGPVTQKVNFIYGFVGAQASILARARAAANLVEGLSASEKLKVQAAIFKEGLQGFTDPYARAAGRFTFSTGHAHIDDPTAQFAGSPLETTGAFPDAAMTAFGRDLPAWMNPGVKAIKKLTKFHKYVRRTMVGSDLVNRAPVWESMIAMQALPEAVALLRKTGQPITQKALEDALDEVNFGVGGREAAVKEAEKTAADEQAAGHLANNDVARRERIRQILQEKLNPLDGMDKAERLVEINNVGRRSTLAYDVPGALGMLSDMLNYIAKRMPLGQQFMAAIRVPIAGVHTAADYGPWGFLRLLAAKNNGGRASASLWVQSWKADLNKNLKFPDPDSAILSPVDMEALRIKATYSTTVFALLAVAIAASLDEDEDKAKWFATAQGPRDPEERRLWRQRGFNPWTIRIAGQDIGYRETPLFSILAPLGAMSDAKRYDNGKYWKDTTTRISSTSLMTLRALTDQAALDSVKKLFEATSGGDGNGAESKLAQTATRMGSSFIGPNLFHDMNDILYGPQDTKNRSWAAALFANVPFSPSFLKSTPALNVFGETLHEQRGGVAGEMFNSLRYRVATAPIDDPEMHFVAKMDIAKLFTGRRKINGDLVMDDPNLVYAWGQRSGKALRAALTPEVISQFEKLKKENSGVALKQFDQFVSSIRTGALNEILNESDK